MTSGQATDFGKWLDGELEERGMTVRELARRIAEQAGSFHAFEHAERNLHNYLGVAARVPRRRMRQAIARALDLEVSSLP